MHFSEFVEHIFETSGSKGAQTERKMYNSSGYVLNDKFLFAP